MLLFGSLEEETETLLLVLVHAEPVDMEARQRIECVEISFRGHVLDMGNYREAELAGFLDVCVDPVVTPHVQQAKICRSQDVSFIGSLLEEAGCFGEVDLLARAEKVLQRLEKEPLGVGRNGGR